MSAWGLTNMRLAVRVHLASQSRCVHSSPHQPPHQYSATFEPLRASVIYSEMVFADAEPYDNPSKYVMQPDPQTDA